MNGSQTWSTKVGEISLANANNRRREILLGSPEKNPLENQKINLLMKALNGFARSVLLLLIGAYRMIGTLFLGGSCRFEPSCSAYALEVAKLHQPRVAVRLITTRVCRCRPGGPFGYDPVPSLEDISRANANGDLK